jgi:hypothetical protein
VKTKLKSDKQKSECVEENFRTERFYQGSISSTFYTHLLRQNFCTKRLQSQNMTREKLRKALLCKKIANKMLMKLTPGGE